MIGQSRRHVDRSGSRVWITIAVGVDVQACLGRWLILYAEDARWLHRIGKDKKRLPLAVSRADLEIQNILLTLTVREAQGPPFPSVI